MASPGLETCILEFGCDSAGTAGNTFKESHFPLWQKYEGEYKKAKKNR